MITRANWNGSQYSLFDHLDIAMKFSIASQWQWQDGNFESNKSH